MLAHWLAVQGVKTRLSSYLMPLRGLSVAVATPATGVALTGHPVVVWPSLVAVLTFAALDGYYLWYERRYRALGDDVRLYRVPFLCMDTRRYAKRVRYRAALFSRTVTPVHTVMLVMLAISGVV
jgi:hypothetical protein